MYLIRLVIHVQLIVISDKLIRHLSRSSNTSFMPILLQLFLSVNHILHLLLSRILYITLFKHDLQAWKNFIHNGVCLTHDLQCHNFGHGDPISFNHVHFFLTNPLPFKALNQ
jgi:hypothetical protein